jgi:hypothetical protein
VIVGASLQSIEAVEDPETRHENAPGAIAISQRSGTEKQACEYKRVAIDNPLQSNECRAKLSPDRRQREIHDRCIKNDHEEGGTGRHNSPSLVRPLSRSRYRIDRLLDRCASVFHYPLRF